MHRDDTGRQGQDPTPDEIAEACAAIQATWSEAERSARLFSGFPRAPRCRHQVNGEDIIAAFVDAELGQRFTHNRNHGLE